MIGNHGDQFNYYRVTAKDPGPVLLLVTIVISVALYALLPCLVACAMRRDQERKEQEDELLKASPGEQEQQGEQPQQKAYSQERASISGICDAQRGSRPVKKIPGAWKHTSKLFKESGLRDNGMTMLDPVRFIQTGIQRVATATHMAHDLKRTGMQRRLSHLEQTDHEDGDNDDGSCGAADGIMVDASAKEEISGIFSYDAMPSDLSVPAGQSSSGIAGGRSTDSNSHNDDDYHCHNPLHVKEMSPIHPLMRTYYTIRNICKWDIENRRILKLALPYVGQALVTGLAEAARVGILASMYDTRSMSAYVICVMLVGFTAEFFGGILDSQGTQKNTSANGYLVHIPTILAITFFFFVVYCIPLRCLVGTIHWIG
jgi:hypothetical protein